MAAPNELPLIPTPKMDAVFSQHYRQLTQMVNYLAGYSGPVSVTNDLDLGGNRIKNVGAAQEDKDAVTKIVADANYSATALKPQLEANGANPFVTYKQLNSGTQREQVSSFLNDLLSTPPNANNIDPIVTGSGSSISVTIPASRFNFSDGTSKLYPSRTDTLTPPATYSISSWSISSGVASVTLSSTPSPPLTASSLVYLSGTGVIDGSQKITNIVSPTEFQFQTTATGSGSSGTVSVGGVAYYYITKNYPIIMLTQLDSGSDTPYNRLSISNDGKQLVAVVSVNSSGVVQTETAGGGTPSNNTANAGSFF